MVGREGFTFYRIRLDFQGYSQITAADVPPPIPPDPNRSQDAAHGQPAVLNVLGELSTGVRETAVLGGARFVFAHCAAARLL